MNKNEGFTAFSLIIPTYKNPKYLDLCLQSIVEGQVNKNQIIVVIDGFEEMYTEVINKYQDDVQFLPLRENQGMAAALNYGVYQAENPDIIIINDDNVLPMEWDTRLSGACKGVVGNVILTINQIEPAPSMFKFHTKDLGTNVESFDLKTFQEYEKSIESKSGFTEDGEIFPFVMRKKDYMMVGGFDTLYPSPFVCDWDLFLKLEMAGITFLRTHLLHIYHFGGRSTKNGPEGRKFSLSETEAYNVFEYKWGRCPFNGPKNSKIPFDKQFRGFSV